MRAVARLVWTFFAATPLMRWFAGVGALASLFGIAGYLVFPECDWTLNTCGRRQALWLQAMLETLPFVGLLLLLAASSLLPAIVERISLGRAIWLLPHGRSRLLVATLLAALLLALLTATTATLAFVSFPVLVLNNQFGISYSLIFWRTLVMAFVDVGLIYAAIWLCGKTSGVWRLVGAFGILLSLTIPLRYVSGIPPFSALEAIGLVFWLMFAIAILAGGGIRHLLAGWRTRFAPDAVFPRAARYQQGNEVDLILGTSRPWIVAFGQIIPVAATLFLFDPRSPWMIVAFVFLILMSAIAGAITSKAAERSRSLWLRCDLNRDQLRARVELAYWRYNLWCVGVLLLAYLGIGLWLRLPGAVVATGATLIVASAVASSCLGLMMTRGLSWLESAFCIVMIAALVRAAFATLFSDFQTAIVLELVLVALAIGFRLLARARWRRLDWMLCRPA